MASAIISGILRSGFISPENIHMYNPHPEKMESFVKQGCTPCVSSAVLAEQCDTVFLCVKPQIFPVVFDELKPVFESKSSDECLIVSIAAGITFKNLQDALGENRPYVRAMPNTPLLLGEGATALSRIALVSEEDFAFVRDIFTCCGLVQEIPESQMDAVIPVSGSSPAYIYLLAKITCDYAEQRGMDRKAAMELFCQTLKGSADMLLHTEKEPQALIDMVTSKGGTTFRLLGVLQDRDFTGTMMDAFDACERRAKELSV